jgi:hypothetical protein
MRRFCTISLWVFWIACALLVFGGTTMVLAFKVPPSTIAPEEAAISIRAFWWMLDIAAIVSVIVFFARRRICFQRSRPIGIGFWSLSFLYFACVYIILASGVAPFFLFSHRGALAWTACALSILFLVLGFPRLPSAAASPVADPPPIG